VLTVRIEEPDGGRREVACPDVDRCLEVVAFETKHGRMWTLVSMMNGAKTLATWGVGPHGKIARKPPRMKRPMR
jgi:hypothetical protein